MSPESVVAERWVLPFSAGSRELVDLLGGKGANLAELERLGVRVPPGFVITTEACRAFLARGSLPDELMTQVRAALSTLGERTGLAFGALSAPLLVSVRSGAPVSMPGMMDTVLNVGLGALTLDGFAASIGDRTVAEDCLRRLEAMYTATVAEAELPDDPWTQLERSVVAVFNSWNSRRAQLYRRYHRIPDSGTAVVIQAMVFGNASSPSGTGVVFTRNPSTGDAEPFGDYLARAQGEDIVAGSHDTDDLDGMRAAVPEAHAELLRTATLVERHFGDMCEIEFTVQDGVLWLLQARSGQRSARASVRIAVQLAREGIIGRDEAIERVGVDELEGLLHPRLDSARLAEDTTLTTGIGASPGLATGAVVLDGARATELAARGERVILVRSETRPDDLDGIIAASGLLTTRGGKTSHAAVVTRGLGKPCVCGASAVVIDAEAGTLRIGEAVVREGETISIDGDSGLVLRGEAPVVTPAPPEETAELLEWCDAIRDLRVAALATVSERIRGAVDAGADEIVLALAASVDDAATLVPEAVAAAGALPVSVLARADAHSEGGRASLERILRAVADSSPEHRTAVVVPERSWEFAAALTRRLALGLSIEASATLDDLGPPPHVVNAVSWEQPLVRSVADAADVLPDGVRLALPPDLSPESLAIARAIGARAVLVPPDRVAVARLALAKGHG